MRTDPPCSCPSTNHRPKIYPSIFFLFRVLRVGFPQKILPFRPDFLIYFSFPYVKFLPATSSNTIKTVFIRQRFFQISINPKQILKTYTPPATPFKNSRHKIIPHPQQTDRALPQNAAISRRSTGRNRNHRQPLIKTTSRSLAPLWARLFVSAQISLQSIHPAESTSPIHYRITEFCLRIPPNHPVIHGRRLNKALVRQTHSRQRNPKQKLRRHIQQFRKQAQTIRASTPPYRSNSRPVALQIFHHRQQRKMICITFCALRIYSQTRKQDMLQNMIPAFRTQTASTKMPLQTRRSRHKEDEFRDRYASFPARRLPLRSRFKSKTKYETRHAAMSANHRKPLGT